MTTTYTGDPDNVVTNQELSVTGATNATPIVITATAHGLATGNVVDIAFVEGNTAANGSGWLITVIDANSFSLDGSVGNGAYTLHGTITVRSLTPEITKPQDGEPRTAASVNAMIDILADRTQFLMRALGMKSKVFTAASTAWVAPDDVGRVGFVHLWGGGGGGGGAQSTASGTNAAGCAGGGGGGSIASLVPVALSAGVSYTAACGTGGAAGTNALGPTAGGAGGTSTFAAPGPSYLAYAKGGEGGGAGGSIVTANTNVGLSIGGTPATNVSTAHRLPLFPVNASAADYRVFAAKPTPGAGGYGTSGANNGLNGFDSTEGYLGGAGGTGGTTSGSNYGGGGGGGGGAGPGGAGGSGATGGNGNNAGTGTAAVQGSTPAANSGAGAGGGAAGGTGSVGTGASAAPKDGATGSVVLYYFGSST